MISPAFALSLFTLLASGPDWDTSYPSAAVATYLDRQNAAVLVVTAGERTASASAAELSLVKALRNGGQTRLVMTGESVSVQAGDGDEAIVKKAQNLPVDLIIVQRVFPGSSAVAPEVAVATIYDKTATSIAAMAATSGQPLPAREQRSKQTAGRSAVVDVLKAKEDKERPPERAKADTRKITFEAGALVNVRSGRVVSSWLTPYQGGRPLQGARLYEVLGRTDLAAQYRGRDGVKLGLYTGGGVVAAAGLVTSLLRFVFPSRCVIYDRASYTCVQTEYPDLLIPGLIGTGVGLTAIIVAAVINPNPVTAREVVDLADQYNEKLESAPTPNAKAGPQKTPSEKPQLSLAVGAMPTPAGFQAALSIRF